MIRPPVAPVAPVSVDGGITAPRGFRAAGVACGIKAAGLDVALIAADTRAAAAGVFTTNLAQAAPVRLSRAHLDSTGGYARAVVVNSGCANACTGQAGAETARAMAEATAAAIGCAAEDVLVASTGVIGVALDERKVRTGIAAAARQLSRDGHHDAARAIMTTDPWPKEYAVAVETSSGTFRVGGITKGSGMIEPLMATMLGFLTTDAQVEPVLLRRALVEAVEDTFNAITVDGECSTNDAVFVLASGASGVRILVEDEAAYGALLEGVRSVCQHLAVEIVRGGEGATKLITIHVRGGATDTEAKRAARVIANSPLVKTAIHGGDPNWGRLIAAAGRAGVGFDLARAAVSIGSIVLFENGRPFDERAAEAASYLRGARIDVEVDLGTGGGGKGRIYTCDLSAEYVRINGEYRT